MKSLLIFVVATAVAAESLTGAVVTSGGCPTGYSYVDRNGWLNGDFNQGAGGAYVYLCVAYDQPGESPISLGIYATSGYTNGCPGTGLTQIGKWGSSNGDFNEGAGGEYIFVCQTTSGRGDGRLVMTESAYRCQGITRYSSNGDFNEGASGKYIYLCQGYNSVDFFISAMIQLEEAVGMNTLGFGFAAASVSLFITGMIVIRSRKMKGALNDPLIKQEGHTSSQEF